MTKPTLLYGWWRTRDNRLLRISAMSDSHLFNTLLMLRRQASIHWNERTRLLLDQIDHLRPAQRIELELLTAYGDTRAYCFAVSAKYTELFADAVRRGMVRNDPAMYEPPEAVMALQDRQDDRTEVIRRVDQYQDMEF
jgi:hypothetical protein